MYKKGNGSRHFLLDKESTNPECPTLFQNQKLTPYTRIFQHELQLPRIKRCKIPTLLVNTVCKILHFQSLIIRNCLPLDQTKHHSLSTQSKKISNSSVILKHILILCYGKFIHCLHIGNLFTLHYFPNFTKHGFGFCLGFMKFHSCIVIFITQCINIRIRKKKNNASLLVKKTQENGIIQTKSKYPLKT